MKKLVLISDITALCLSLSACSYFQSEDSQQSTNDSSSSITSVPSTSSVEDLPLEKEKVSIEIPKYCANLDQYGNLEIDYSSSSSTTLNWARLDGYFITNESEIPDFTPPGIQDEGSTRILDLLQLIYSDVTNLIEYQSNLPVRMDLFHHVGNSGRYDYFLSAMAYDGNGWQRNQSGSSDFGYLLDIWVELDEQNYLRFHFYFNGNQEYDSYESFPEETRNQLITIINSFEF